MRPELLGEAFSRTHDEGEAWWWLGSLAVIKATGKETGGRFTLVEITEAPRAEAPPHVHHREDEGFFILDGEATFDVAGKAIRAKAGDFVFGPRDVPHAYVAGPAGVKMLFLFAPAGFEGCIREMGTPARARTLPPADEPMPDLEKLKEIAARYGTDLLL